MSVVPMLNKDVLENVNKNSDRVALEELFEKAKECKAALRNAPPNKVQPIITQHCIQHATSKIRGEFRSDSEGLTLKQLLSMFGWFVVAIVAINVWL